MDKMLIDFITGLNQCESFEEAWKLYQKVISEQGITQSLYGITLTPSDKRGEEDFLYHTNYSDGFMREYDDNQLSEYDVLVDWCQQRLEPYEWNTLDFNLTKQQQVLEELSNDYQIQWGYTIPLRLLLGDAWGGVGLCAVGISKKEFEKDVKPNYEYIQLITHTFHSFVQRFPRFTEELTNYDHVIGRLNTNEIETLKWLIHGLSIKEIANKKLFKSVDMVNKYINSAKNKLNAINRDQLIAKAMILGLV